MKRSKVKRYWQAAVGPDKVVLGKQEFELPRRTTPNNGSMAKFVAELAGHPVINISIRGGGGGRTAIIHHTSG